MENDKTLDLRGLPEEIQVLEVSALMLFPADEEERIHWILRTLLAYGAEIYSCEHKSEDTPAKEATLNARLGYHIGMLITRYGGWVALAKATIGNHHNYNPLTKQTQKRILNGVRTGHVLFEAIKNECGHWCPNVEAIKCYN